MSKRQVIETPGEHARSHVSQGSDIEFAHAVTIDGLSTGCEQVSHGDDGNIDPDFLAPPSSLGGHGCVMCPDALYQLPFLVLHALARFSHAYVPVAKAGHGTDDKFRSAMPVAEYKHFLFQ